MHPYPTTRLSEAARQCGSLYRFAERHNLPATQVADWINQEAFIHQQRIYRRISQLTPVFSPDMHHTLTSLREHIDRDHEGSSRDFSRVHSLPFERIETWLRQQAVWLDGEVCLPVAALGDIEAVPLKRHIQQAFGGNNTAFAQAYQKTQQQISRWVLRDCYWALGEVHMRRTEYTPQKVINKPTTAIRLQDLINTDYQGDENAFYQAYRHLGLGKQQLDRFLAYDSLWIQGEIYKNQSKFKARGITRTTPAITKGE
jgi:hypothetical protein